MDPTLRANISIGGRHDYIETKRNEYRLTHESNNIRLEFPSAFDTAIARLQRRCMKIDHCVIEYRNQVPFNSKGTVIVEILDKRLTMDDAKQASFTFPISCNVDLHYYSSSFFSMSDESPWELLYRVEDTNVHVDTSFAMIKAKLKLSTAKHSTNVSFKPPTIKIMSPDFKPDDVDFWSVSKPAHIRRPILDDNRGMTRAMSQRINLLPGESWASRSMVGSMCSRRSVDGEHPYRHLHRLDDAAINPGDSVSEIGNSELTEQRLAQIVEATVNKCMIKNADKASSSNL